MIKKISECIATLFYAGHFPIAPGTAGTLLALILISPLIRVPSILGCFLAFVLVTLLGFVFIPFYLEGKTDDLQEIVIDEASGLYLSILISMITVKFSGMTPKWYIIFILCFIFFRIFDVTKPLAVGYFDRNFKGAIGIMLDDIGAGVFAGMVMTILILIYKYVIL